MPIKKIEFGGSQGFPLAARLDMPAVQPRAFAIFAHCFTCSKDILAASRIARALSTKGIAVLRFDFTGLGHSEGEFANTNFSSNIQDFLKAADWLREHHSAPSLLIGHSLGGAAVLATAGEIEEVVGVATIGAPFDPQHVSQLFEEQRDEIEQTGIAEVKLAGRKFTIQRQFLEDLNAHAMAGKIGSLRRALIVFHAPFDNVVGIDNAARIFQAAKHPKDCEDCETKHGRLDRIDKTIELTGELDDAQHACLMEIADRCPVYRTLQSEVIVHSKQG